MSDSRPIAVDLFGGVGGMALGFEQAGFDVVCAVEYDPAHAAAHRFNFPYCEVLQRDATELTGVELRRGVRRGLERHGRGKGRQKVDVIFGGPPCQGFSVGGLMDPKDPRNELVEDFVRLVVELEPKAFVMENVPAMASRSLPGRAATVPGWLRRRMRDAGYTVALPNILNSSSYGVPQNRRRLVIVGVRGARVPPGPPSETHAPRTPVSTAGSDAHRMGEPVECGRPLGPSVWDAIGDLPDLDGYDELLSSDSVRLPEEVRKVMKASASPYARILAGFDVDPSDLSRPRRRSPSRLTSSLRTVHSVEVVERFKATRPGEREAISRFMRLDPDGVSSTLRAGSTPDRGSFSAPRPIHPVMPRVISVREAARLHGFPDWFRFSAAKWHGFRQVGNAVCPPFARAIAASVRDGLSLPKVEPSGERLSLGDERLLRIPSGAGRRSGHPSPVEGDTEVDDNGIEVEVPRAA